MSTLLIAAKSHPEHPKLLRREGLVQWGRNAHFQPRFSILDKVSLAVILELAGWKNDKIAIQQLEKVQNTIGKLLEKVQKVQKKLLEKVQKLHQQVRSLPLNAIRLTFCRLQGGRPYHLPATVYDAVVVVSRRFFRLFPIHFILFQPNHPTFTTFQKYTTLFYGRKDVNMPLFWGSFFGDVSFFRHRGHLFLHGRGIDG